VGFAGLFSAIAGTTGTVRLFIQIDQEIWVLAAAITLRPLLEEHSFVVLYKQACKETTYTQDEKT